MLLESEVTPKERVMPGLVTTPDTPMWALPPRRRAQPIVEAAEANTPLRNSHLDEVQSSNQRQSHL